METAVGGENLLVVTMVAVREEDLLVVTTVAVREESSSRQSPHHPTTSQPQLAWSSMPVHMSVGAV